MAALPGQSAIGSYSSWISRAEALSSAAAPVSVLVVAFPGGAGTASLVREARRLAARAPVPLSVAQISQAPTLP